MSELRKKLDKEFVYSADEVEGLVSKEIAPLCNGNRIVTLAGLLGAGKTTLTQSLLRQCGVEGHITSPTFAYVNSYALSDGRRCHHFDLYRVPSQEAFCQMGFEEYLQGNDLVIIEWPQVIENLLKTYEERLLTLSLSYQETDHSVRKIVIW